MVQLGSGGDGTDDITLAKNQVGRTIKVKLYF